MDNTLSHSQCSKYQLCGMSYYYHYKEKLRPKTTTGALLFGSALDAALNQLLLPSSNETAEEVFLREFSRATINKIVHAAPTCKYIMYANSDMDLDLLTESDLQTLSTYEGWKENINSIKNKKTAIGFNLLAATEKEIFNVVNWHSMYRKGLLMLKSYREKVLPKIERVHCVQRRVSLSNGTGDSIVGFVDLVADIKDIGTVILDHKTSTRDYSKSAVLTSSQLSLYTHILQDEYKTRKAGFIVMYKQAVKNRLKICSKCGFDGSSTRHKTCNNQIDGERCDGDWVETLSPEIKIDIIIDEVPHGLDEIVLQTYDTVNMCVKSNLFPRNFGACHDTYGGDCVYLDKCFKNKETNLVRMEEDNG